MQTGPNGDQVMNPNTALLVIFSVLALIGVAGIVITLTNKGLKWKNRP